jgi:hypothetical protein
MLGGFSTHKGGEKYVQNFGLEKRRGHITDLGVYWSAIIKWTFKELERGDSTNILNCSRIIFTYGIL